jgi:hypothetical protein
MLMFAFGDKEWSGLAKLNEESGELVQVIGKLMMTHGERAYWGSVDLRRRLIEEMADQAAAIGFVTTHVLTPREGEILTARMMEKRALFEKWHEEQQAGPDPAQAEIEHRVQEETESIRKRHEDTYRALCERNSEIAELKRSNDALVRALGQKDPVL